jgi:aspartyl-tRNA(Asn)/glutamyl-tRNA(Gln) amidotransferase subunit A
VPLSVSLDHVGPLAASVSDAWAIYDALTGSGHQAESASTIGGVRLGRLGGYFLETLDADVRARFEEALSRLMNAGAAIVDVELRRLPDIAATYVNVALPEAFACHSDALKHAPEEFGRNVRDRLEMGGQISRDAYIKAQSDRAQMRNAVDSALSGCDALVLPTMPIPPQPVGATTVVVDSIEQPLRPLTLKLTQLFNLTGHPAISIPCGETRDGLPCGIQLVGRHKQTPELLQASLSCEAFVTPRALSSSSRP